MKRPALWSALILVILVSTVAISCAKAKKDIELRVAIENLAGEFLDPLEGSATSFYILDHMYDSLVGIAPGGALAPAIAKRWEVAPDGLSYTFYLRDDVVFHDGSKLTAEDVKFSIERQCSDKSRDVAVQKSVFGDKPRVDILDPHTVRVYTNGTQPDLLKLEQPSLIIVPKAYIQKNGYEYFKLHPIGSGPYKFVRLAPGDRMEFEAVNYPHWRTGVPEFKRITVYQIPEEMTRVAMLQTGQLDEIPVSLKSALTLRAKGFTVIEGDSMVNMFWFVGAYHPRAKGMPLTDVRVRQALSLAINRKEIVDTIFSGFGDYKPLPRSCWQTPEVAVWSPETKAKWQAWVEKNYRYDPEEAKRLIKEAGYGNGFEFTFWVTPDVEFSAITDLVQACAGYWQKVGARCSIVNVETATYKANRHTKKSTKLIGGMGSDTNPYPQPSAIRQWERWTTDQGSMDLMVGNAEFLSKYDELFAKAATEMDISKRAAFLDQMMETCLPTWVYFNTVGAPSMFAFGPRVKPYLPVPFETPADYYANWKYTGVEPK